LSTGIKGEMLKNRAGEIIGRGPKVPRDVEPEALTVHEAACVSGICRTVLYQAMNQDLKEL
jgi:hypothetical protein